MLTVALLAPPIFAYGAGWGAIYLIPAAVTLALLRWRGREWAALLPGIVPFAVHLGVGLVILPVAGALMRRWGALLGFLSGLVLVVTAGLAGWSVLPYTFNPGPGAVLKAAEHAVSPWTVLLEIARFLDSRPELALQLLLFTVFPCLGTRLEWVSGTQDVGASTYLIILFSALSLSRSWPWGAGPTRAVSGDLYPVRYNRLPGCLSSLRAGRYL